MHIYCLEIQLSIPASSLKGKRGIVKSILGRARNRFNISCAEIDRQDNHGIAVLGFVTISPERTVALNCMQRLEDWIFDSWPEAEITASQLTEL